MTIRELVAAAEKTLRESGIEDARFDAEQLARFVLGCGSAGLVACCRDEAAADTASRLSALVKRRAEGEPLQYILGEWEFCGLPFKVGEGVLIPRPDTEILAELAAEFLKARPANSRRVLDLCAGSGCIGITLSKLCGAKAALVELSETAFFYLRQNIALCGVEGDCAAVLGDALSGSVVGGDFDAVVSNPPYLTAKDMASLQREVSFEPKTALYGGEDGLDYYRKLVPLWGKRLRPGGLIAVEIGMGEEAAVSEIFTKNGLSPQLKKDYNNIYRVVYAVNRRT